MKGRAGIWIALLLGIPLASAPLRGQSIAGSANAVHQHWVDEGSAGLDPRAVDALRRIRGPDRRLLALRAYLRAGDSLAARWSWSENQLASYPATPEGKTAAADIEAVVTAFSSANPGYSLQVNRQPRSLEVQLAHWNENASVSAVSAALTRFLEGRFAAYSSPSVLELRDALIHWTPDSAAALAAPGLSAHGQGRAFDFAVTRNGQIVAGLDAASAHARWDVAGWTQKLHDVMKTAGRHFTGPLTSPYEPWHYAYLPP